MLRVYILHENKICYVILSNQWYKSKKKLQMPFVNHLPLSVFSYSYALFHANRKAFSNVKKTTQEVWTPSNENETLQIKPDSVSK